MTSSMPDLGTTKFGVVTVKIPLQLVMVIMRLMPKVIMTRSLLE